SLSMFEFSVPNVMADAIKKAEDGERLVLRIHEFAGVRTHVDMKSDFRIKSCQECDLMERPIGVVEASNIELKPYEIKTFLVSLEV
ncbi:glycosyl hydrolase-related protein, partial [Paenibacillus sp. TAF58]